MCTMKYQNKLSILSKTVIVSRNIFRYTTHFSCSFSHLPCVLLFLIFSLFQVVTRGRSEAVSWLISSVTLDMIQPSEKCGLLIHKMSI